ncbi:ABC transporter ATP-binding protein [Moritella marina ATCC 15381]|uniref:ABC transporter ATP-binding protein n=1 Tax=Moritella marina ATCC 15381 TaxID=1202962 RepID=A0A5J6WJN3_MORMI|nr:ABC transporter ATP-binding protein [Moritella marina]QFI36602.1 ABC transporter ATP-binding protein [Moritella marina ATCC 15381]
MPEEIINSPSTTRIQPLLRVEKLGKTYINPTGFFKRQEVVAVNDISFSLNRGETLAIIGETGSGKSTLARLLAGVIPPTTGHIYIDGCKLDVGNSDLRCRSIRMVFQDPETSLNPRTSVGQILDAPLQLNTDMSVAKRTEKITDTLRLVGLLPEYATFYPPMLSSGQKQRIALARALILNPKIIIADDTLSTLDISLRSQMINLMLELQRTIGISYIIVTHNMGLVKHISDKMIVMHQGECIEQGNSEQLFSNPTAALCGQILSNQYNMKKTNCK